MCDRMPLRCALRDDHAGVCVNPDTLEAMITNLTSTLDSELAEIRTPPPQHPYPR